MLIIYLIYSLVVNVTRENVSKVDKFKCPLYLESTHTVFSQLQNSCFMNIMYEYFFLTYTTYTKHIIYRNVHKYYTDPIGGVV